MTAVALLAETHGRMLAHLRGLAFFSEEPLASALHYVSAYRVLTQEGRKRREGGK